MNKLDLIPVSWGVADLLSIAWYAGMMAVQGEIPVVQDISDGIKNIEMFELPQFTFLIYIAVILYVSPILSGILLILKKRIGVILSYIQIPFRLVLIIPPSIFFILWPLNESIQPRTALLLGFSLVFISEAIKLTSLVLWNKSKSA